MKRHPQGCGQGAEVHTLWGSGCASSPSVGPLHTTQGPPARQGWPYSLPGFPLMPSPFRVTAPTAPRAKLLGSAGSGRWPRPGRCFTDSSRRYGSPPPRLQAHLRSCSALPPDPGVTGWGALGICVGRACWRAAVRRVRADVPAPRLHRAWEPGSLHHGRCPAKWRERAPLPGPSGRGSNILSAQPASPQKSQGSGLPWPGARSRQPQLAPGLACVPPPCRCPFSGLGRSRAACSGLIVEMCASST